MVVGAAASTQTIPATNINSKSRSTITTVDQDLQDCLETLETQALRVTQVDREILAPTVIQASALMAVRLVTQEQVVTPVAMVIQETQALLVTQVLARRMETQEEKALLGTQVVTVILAAPALLETQAPAQDLGTQVVQLLTHGQGSSALVETLVTQVDLETQARELDLVTQVVRLLRRGLVSLDQQATLAILARRVMLVLSEPLAMQV